MEVGMKRFLGTAFTLVLMAVAAGAALMWSGVVSVAANDPHLPVTQWILDTGRIRSIKMHAAGIVSPGNLADRARVVGGTAHFAEHCAGCHSAPGVGAEDMAEGMYPKPPALTEAARRWTPGELFWILKNGIKMSGMPSWADHGDEALWDIVAFLEKAARDERAELWPARHGLDEGWRPSHARRGHRHGRDAGSTRRQRCG
jgi:mono/diheme cytochrome c family protein